MLVHPDRTGGDPRRHGERPVEVRRPDRTSETEFRVVGSFNHFVDVGVVHHRQHRAELLLADQSGSSGMSRTMAGRTKYPSRSSSSTSAARWLCSTSGRLAASTAFTTNRTTTAGT